MKKTIIIVLMSIIGIGFTNAQEELKGKKLKERLDSVYLNLQTGKYLEAIDLFYKKDYNTTDRTKSDNYYQAISYFIKSIESIYRFQIESLKSPGTYDGGLFENYNYFYSNSYPESEYLKNLINKPNSYYRKDDVDITNLLVLALKSLRSKVNLNPILVERKYLDSSYLTNIIDSMKTESNDNRYSNKYINELKELHNQKFSIYIECNKAIYTINQLTSKLNPNNLESEIFQNQVDSIFKIKNEFAKKVYKLNEGKYVFIHLLSNKDDIYNGVISNYISQLTIDSISKKDFYLTIDRLELIRNLNKDKNIKKSYEMSFSGFEINDDNISLINSKINEFYTLNPFKEDMSKPIPNLGKETIKYFIDNCITIYQLDAKFIDILNLNIYNYYDLTNYDTPLKKQLFEESEDYKNYKKALIKKKESIEKSNIIIPVWYTNDPDYYQKKLSRFLIVGNYNLKSGGFTFKFNCTNKNSMSDVSYKLPIKTFRAGNGGEIFMNLNSVQLPLIPKEYVTNELYGFTSYGEEMFLPIDKLSALEIENNPDNLAFYFITLDKIKSQKWTTEKSAFDPDGNYGLLSTDRVKMVVINTETGKIYFEKIYEKIVPKK